MSENGIITEKDAEIMAEWVGFRNILIHEYTGVDLKIVHKTVSEELDQLNPIIKILTKELKDELK